MESCIDVHFHYYYYYDIVVVKIKYHYDKDIIGIFLILRILECNVQITGQCSRFITILILSAVSSLIFPSFTSGWVSLRDVSSV